MRITGSLYRECGSGPDCAEIHDTDEDKVIVQGDALRDVDADTYAGIRCGEGEDAVVVPRAALDGPRLSLDQMVEYIDARHTFDLLRVENRRTYASASDGGDFARFLSGEHEPLEGGQWMAKLAAERRAGRGRRKVHTIIDSEMSDYELFECAWAFPRTAAAGEDVRILDTEAGAVLDVPDFLLVDHQYVVVMHYGDDHRFAYARPLTGPDAAVYRALARALWSGAEDFRTWWANRSDLHRGDAA